MVRSAWARLAGATVAAVAAVVVHGSQAGCFYPDYTFNEPEPSGGGGATTTAAGGTSSTSSAGAGGASSTSTATSGSVGDASSTSASASASASSSASSSGTGGVTIGAGDMIDDMEAGSGNILQQGGRIGSWYTYNDGSVGATQAPVAGGPFLPEMIADGHGASTEAAHTAGAGFTLWGSGMGFDLHNDGTTKQAYSVAAFTGVAFWAKGSPASIRLKVLILATVAVAEGGTCATSCGDSHGAILALTGAWKPYIIPFASLKQQNWGTPAAWDPTTVLSIQFQAGIGAEDFWIDDIGLY